MRRQAPPPANRRVRNQPIVRAQPLQPYLPSLRTLGGTKAPVLIKAGELGGPWLPPMRVYLAADVDELLVALGVVSVTVHRRTPEGKQ